MGSKENVFYNKVFYTKPIQTNFYSGKNVGGA